jgi:hypothetical protein
MEENKMALLDKVLGRDERETQLKQEIKSLELRKESVFSAIDGEIARLQRERSNVLLGAGTAAYNAWCRDEAQVDLSEYWGKIQELEQMVAVQEAKKAEMGNKYDEEIKLINTNLGISNIAPAMRCPKCGAGIKENDLFCQNCGEKLK